MQIEDDMRCDEGEEEEEQQSQEEQGEQDEEDILLGGFPDQDDEEELLHDDLACLAHDDEDSDEMKQAMDQVPSFEKREYYEAVEQVPELVARESPWEDFMWTEDYNTYRAALRLARYWKARKFLFGQERWLRPLNQTGRGALWEADVEMLRSGFFVMLKRQSGGVVLLVDFSRLSRASWVDGDSMTRLSFYMVHLYGKEMRKGFTSLHIVGNSPNAPIPLKSEGYAVTYVALPVKSHKKRVFIIQSCFEPGREALLDFITFRLQKTIDSMSKEGPKRIVGHSIQQTLALVQQATNGLERNCLPLSVGGDFDYKMFDGWMQHRLCVEFSQLSMCTTFPSSPAAHSWWTRSYALSNLSTHRQLLLDSPHAMVENHGGCITDSSRRDHSPASEDHTLSTEATRPTQPEPVRGGTSSAATAPALSVLPCGQTLHWVDYRNHFS